MMVLALAAVQRGDRKGSLLWLLMTALASASIFLGFQAYEFTHFYHAGLTLGTNLFGSSFFILTGFHGAHVHHRRDLAADRCGCRRSEAGSGPGTQSR